MKRIIATTAFALMLGTSNLAAQNAVEPLNTVQMQEQGDIHASELIGMRIYATDTNVGEGYGYQAGMEKEWEDIGEVNDVLLSEDGKVRAVLLGIGGFLGMGEHDIAVSMTDIHTVRESADSREYFLVVNANKQTLEDAPAYSRLEDSAMVGTDKTASINGEKAATEVGQPATSANVDDGTAGVAEQRTANVDRGTTATDRMMLPQPNVAREGYRVVTPKELTADTLQSARVYDINNADVGEISELILTDDGKIERVVIDVGGFLGIGEHPIAVTMEELRILRTEDGADWRVYIDATEEQLEQQPAYTRQG